MRALVYPHSMEIGGSQINAVDLARSVRDLGHEVLIVSEPGPVVDLVRDAGIEWLPIALERRRPSGQVMALLKAAVQKRQVDVVHGYEWPPVVEAYLGPGRALGVPIVGTVMSAAVAPFIPKSLPLAVGTAELARRVTADGYRDVTLIEPPVDVEHNSPDVSPGDFRRRNGVSETSLLLVVVCRLARELKLEGLLSACDATAALARDGFDVSLAIVGDGDERDIVAERARTANDLAGRRVVATVGEVADPRPAYAAADVILGMGGSALRGMAFGKPLVVQGEQGFWRLCTPATIEGFLDGGWYGLGDGGDGSIALRSELEPLLRSAQMRQSLGAFNREQVVSRFGLRGAARVQVELYERAVSSARRGARPSGRELVRTTALLGTYKVARRVERLRGVHAADDFNSVKKMALQRTVNE